MVGQSRSVIPGRQGDLVEELPILQRRHDGSGTVRSTGRKLQVDLLDVVEPLLSGAKLSPGHSLGLGHVSAGLLHPSPGRREPRAIETGVHSVHERQVPLGFPHGHIALGSLPIRRPGMDPEAPLWKQRVLRVFGRKRRQRPSGAGQVSLQQEGPHEVGVGRVGRARTGDGLVVQRCRPIELFRGHVGVGQVVQGRAVVGVHAKHTVVGADDCVPVPGDNVVVGGFRDEAFPLGQAMPVSKGCLQGLYLSLSLDIQVEEGHGQLPVGHGEGGVQGDGLPQQGQGLRRVTLVEPSLRLREPLQRFQRGRGDLSQPGRLADGTEGFARLLPDVFRQLVDGPDDLVRALGGPPEGSQGLAGLGGPESGGEDVPRARSPHLTLQHGLHPVPLRHLPGKLCGEELAGIPLHPGKNLPDNGGLRQGDGTGPGQVDAKGLRNH